MAPKGAAQCWTVTIWAKNENKLSVDYGKVWEPLKKLPKDVQFVAWQMEKGKCAKKAEMGQYKLLKATDALSDESINTKEIHKKIKNGKVHYQLYLQFYNGCERGFKAVKNALKCDWANVRPSRGTDEQNQAYITKLETAISGTYKAFGERVANKGKRNDWVEIVELIDGGASVSDIIKQFPSKLMCINALIQYHRMAENKRFKYAPFKKKEVTVIWGEAGTGKTRHAYDLYNNEAEGGVYVPEPTSDGKIWWDGYSGEETVILDDFNGSMMKTGALCRFLDGYQIRLPNKGGYAQSRIKRVIITSNNKPESFYANGIRKNLHRRITNCLHVFRDAYGCEVWADYNIEMSTGATKQTNGLFNGLADGVYQPTGLCNIPRVTDVNDCDEY